MGHFGNGSKDHVVSMFCSVKVGRLCWEEGKKLSLALQTLLSINPYGELIPKNLGILMCKSNSRSYG